MSSVGDGHSLSGVWSCHQWAMVTHLVEYGHVVSGVWSCDQWAMVM